MRSRRGPDDEGEGGLSAPGGLVLGFFGMAIFLLFTIGVPFLATYKVLTPPLKNTTVSISSTKGPTVSGNPPPLSPSAPTPPPASPPAKLPRGLSVSSVSTADASNNTNENAVNARGITISSGALVVAYQTADGAKLLLETAGDTMTLPFTSGGGDGSSAAYTRVDDARILPLPNDKCLVVARVSGGGAFSPTNRDAITSMIVPLSPYSLPAAVSTYPAIAQHERLEDFAAVSDATLLLVTSTMTGAIVLRRFHVPSSQWLSIHQPSQLFASANPQRISGPQGFGSKIISSGNPLNPTTWYLGYVADNGDFVIGLRSTNGGTVFDSLPSNLPPPRADFSPAVQLEKQGGGSYHVWESSAFDLFYEPGDLGALTFGVLTPTPINKTARYWPGMGSPRPFCSRSLGVCAAVGASSMGDATARTVEVSSRTCQARDSGCGWSGTNAVLSTCTPNEEALASSCRLVRAPLDQAVILTSVTDWRTQSQATVVDLAAQTAGEQTVALALAIHAPSQSLLVIYERYGASSAQSWPVELRAALFNAKTLARIGSPAVLDSYDARLREGVMDYYSTARNGLTPIIASGAANSFIVPYIQGSTGQVAQATLTLVF